MQHVILYIFLNCLFAGPTGKMSRADQLLSKLPPPTPLPSFVTDALEGNHFMNVFISIHFNLDVFFSINI